MSAAPEIYVFRTGIRGEVGYTFDNTGSNLPPCDPNDPWAHVYTVEPTLIAQRSTAARMKAIAARVAREGCYVTPDLHPTSEGCGLC